MGISLTGDSHTMVTQTINAHKCVVIPKLWVVLYIASV